VTGPDANGLITWHLGAMAAGTSRQVTFQVIIKDVSGPAGTTIAEDIINQGTVQTHETPVTPSNVVVTPVSKVLPVKVGPKQLPHTGADLPVGPTVGGGILLLGLGILLVATTRRRRAGLLG
jgi:LPXTG-motif cell wall-anchored protein